MTSFRGGGFAGVDYVLASRVRLADERTSHHLCLSGFISRNLSLFLDLPLVNKLGLCALYRERPLIYRWRMHLQLAGGLSTRRSQLSSGWLVRVQLWFGRTVRPQGAMRERARELAMVRTMARYTGQQTNIAKFYGLALALQDADPARTLRVYTDPKLVIRTICYLLLAGPSCRARMGACERATHSALCEYLPAGCSCYLRVGQGTLRDRG